MFAGRDVVYNWGAVFISGEEQGNGHRNTWEEFWLIMQDEWELQPKKDIPVQSRKPKSWLLIVKKTKKVLRLEKNSTDAVFYSFFKIFSFFFCHRKWHSILLFI